MLANFTDVVKRGSLDESLLAQIEWSRHNTGMTLSVALNYGGRAEIVDAVRASVRALAAEGRAPEEITEDDIGRKLYTRGLPELDLLVRTSGELRISNFLLWQAAYSEIYVTDTLWPDFRRTHLLEAVIDFQRVRAAEVGPERVGHEDR